MLKIIDSPFPIEHILPAYRSETKARPNQFATTAEQDGASIRYQASDALGDFLTWAREARIKIQTA